MCLSLISLSSAQQQHNSPSGSCGVGLCFIQNTTSPQNANFDITGNGVAWGTLQGNLVQGNTINNFGSYQIGGINVLSIGSAADNNLLVGPNVGLNIVQGQGIDNVFLGGKAGYSNTTGESNTFAGYGAGYTNTDGTSNTYLGNGAGYLNDGNSNVFVGLGSGGLAAGSHNTYVGTNAGLNTGGRYNVFVGDSAGIGNSGANGVIYIGSQGVDGEGHTIRIGGDLGGGTQTATYIAGIYGTNVHGNYVYVTSDGQLGTASSSRRFKEQIKDMGDSTDSLMKLRPVTFLYKPEYANGDNTLQYGLIAEEVAEVYPDLVSYEKDGKTPYTVRYQYLASMLLNEVQKQYHRAEEQTGVIETQQKQIKVQAREIESLRQQVQLQNASMQERMSKLESLVDRQTTVARK
jgi:hypothetical protein